MGIIEEAYNGKLEAVRDLITQGVNINIQNDLGRTALMEAVYHNDIPILRILIEANADLNIARNGGHTALMLACKKGYLEIVKILIASNADINVTDDNGKNALSLFVINQIRLDVEVLSSDNIEMLNTLLDIGADIDKTNEHLMNILNILKKTIEKEEAEEKSKPIKSDDVITLLKEVSFMAKEQNMETRDILSVYQILELRRQSNILSLTKILNDESIQQIEKKIDVLIRSIEDIPSYINDSE
jgi:hypothetical protein